MLVLVLCGLVGLAMSAKNKDYTNAAFQKRCAEAHNALRRQHGAPDLIVDPKLVAFATKRARTLAKTEKFKHDAGNYGENLAWQWSSRGVAPVDCGTPVGNWYNEIKDYRFADGSSTGVTGHFTQVVWKGSSRIGCGQAASFGPKGGVYTVCNYDPPGNYVGQNKANVSPKK